MRTSFVLILMTLIVGACAGAVPDEDASSPTSVSLETEIAKAVEGTVAVASTEAAAEESQTEEAGPAATATEMLSPTPSPTPTESPSATPEASPSPSPTATKAAFDPTDEYGGPTILDTFSSDSNWVDGNGDLPNSDFLRMALGTNQMLVTGKPANFDTWWFTWPSAGDQYLEMKVEVENCNGRQAYGLFLRGPADAADARGYILTFSCDGAYRLRRLDDLNPYTFVDLVPWTNSDLINSGDDELNVLGVRLIGDTITIFANGEEVDEVEDATYASGRFGLFVNAGPPGDFTFILNELSFWNLDN